MKIIISGGGTGGHIYPALAIAQGLKERVPSADIFYVGTARGMESKIVPNAGFTFKSIDVAGIDRSSILKASKSLAKLPVSFLQAWEIIKKFKPDVVVGTGGYVSFPVVLAATFFACKTIIHEQNAVPGLANSRLAKRVDYTLLTFGETRRFLDAKCIIVTGLPVRKEIIGVNREKARKNLGFAEDKFTLVAFGGSQGAASINMAMKKVVEKSQKDDIQIIWVTGESAYEEVKKDIEENTPLEKMSCRLLLFPYMYNIEQAMAAADLAICRAGASTLSELAILGLPAILVPYPYAAESHQEKNARYLVEKKAAELVIDEFLDGDTLYKKISKLKNDRQKLKEMSINMQREARPNALNDILDVILKY